MIKRFERPALLPALVCAFVLFSCSSTWESRTFNSLSTAGAIYHSTMLSVAELDAQGCLTPDQKKTVSKIAKIYYSSYMACVDAFELYLAEQTWGNRKAVERAMEMMNTRFADFLITTRDLADE